MKILFMQISRRVTVLTLGAALAVAGSALAFTQKSKPEFQRVALNLPVDERPLTREMGSHNSFAPVVKKVAPAVVKVFTTTKVHNTAYSSAPPGMDDFFRHFFGD